MSHEAPDWSRIETEDESGYFVRYLDTATAQAEMQRYKQKTYALVGAQGPARILDVGCGTGDDALAMAERIGTGGAIIGLDASDTLVEEARRRTASKDLPVEFLTGDVHRLAFDDAEFDGCRADRVFMHLENPGQALAEMVRVTRPGGRVLVREPDWDTLVIDSPERDLTRNILHHHFDAALRHSRIGRQLYRLFRQAGLVDVAAADCSTLVLTDFETADRLYGLEDAAARMTRQQPELAPRIAAWLADLRRADREGRFFSAVTGYTVVGMKPA